MTSPHPAPHAPGPALHVGAPARPPSGPRGPGRPLCSQVQRPRPRTAGPLPRWPGRRVDLGDQEEGDAGGRGQQASPWVPRKAAPAPSPRPRTPRTGPARRSLVSGLFPCGGPSARTARGPHPQPYSRVRVHKPRAEKKKTQEGLWPRPAETLAQGHTALGALQPTPQALTARPVKEGCACPLRTPKARLLGGRCGTGQDPDSPSPWGESPGHEKQKMAPGHCEGRGSDETQKYSRGVLGEEPPEPAGDSEHTGGSPGTGCLRVLAAWPGS